MSLILAVVLGALGAAIRELFELAEVVRSRRGDIPDDWRRSPFVIAELLRIAGGSVVAVVLYGFDQVGPGGAVIVGMLGPAFVQRIFDPPRGSAR